MKYLCRTLACAVAAVAVAADSASALTLLATGGSTTPVEISIPGGQQALPLTSTGAVALPFKTAKINQKVIIQVSTMCHVTVPAGASAESITAIAIDNTLSGDTIACGTANGNTPITNTSTYNYVATVPAIGSHTVQLIGLNNGTATAFYKWSVIVER